MAEKTKVTRISAKDDAPAKAVAPKKTSAKGVKVSKTAKKVQKNTAQNKKRRGGMRVLASIGGYFKGAWVELKQVRWPTRKATWGLSLAVILFSAFFVVLILLLDGLFQYLFDFIIG